MSIYSSKVINKNMDFDEQAKLLFERLNLEYGGRSAGGSYWNPIGNIQYEHYAWTYTTNHMNTIHVHAQWIVIMEHVDWLHWMECVLYGCC